MNDEKDVDIEEDDPTKLPEGAVVIPSEEDDSDEAYQGGSSPDKETLEQLHGTAWQAAADAQAEGLI